MQKLVEMGANVSSTCTCYLGFFPLLAASSNGHLEMVQYLVENGADVNAKNIQNETPVHFASVRDNLPIVNILIRNFANVNAEGFDANTPVHYAAYYGRSDVLQALINTGRAQINKKTSACNESSLHQAASGGNVSCVKILLENGADISLEDSLGETPLETVQQLLKNETMYDMERRERLQEIENILSSLKEETS